MKNNYLLVLTFLLSTFFLLSSCVGLRSGKGLSQGELHVGYIAPLAGAVRYGVTDNIESRYTVIFENSNFDLYFHTNDDSSLYNYGFLYGTSWSLEKSNSFMVE